MNTVARSWFAVLAGMLAVSGTAVLAATASADTTTFSDGGFSDTDWTVAIVFDDSGGSGALVQANQQSPGGNPDEYRHVVHDWECCGTFWAAHLRSGATYDPGVTGVITSVSYSWDVKQVAIDSGPAAVGYSLLLSQGGEHYTAGYQLIRVSDPLDTWINFTFVATQADFQRIDPVLGVSAGTPDFSANGSPIQFGFFSQDGTQIHGLKSSTTGIDNWSVTVHSCAAASSSDYGTGTPGTSCTPLLEIDASPSLGSTVTLTATNCLGSLTPGFLTVGLAPARLACGCGELLVNPPWTQVIPVPVPVVGMSLSGAVPGDPTLCGVTVYLQLLQIDPGACGGLSMSQGLELTLGS